jgi:two-component system chemotaxis sensor kinase CheA
MSAGRSGSGGLGDMAAFEAIFYEEVDEHIAAIERTLLEVEHAALTVEHFNEIFRAAHSIKGSSGMLGFTEIVSLTHLMENLLDILRQGERQATAQDVDAVLRAGDLVKAQLAFRKGSGAAAPDAGEIESLLRTLMAEGTTTSRDGAPPAPTRYSVRLGPLDAPIDDAELETMLSSLAEMGELTRSDVRNAAGGQISFDVALAGSSAGELKSTLALMLPPELIEVQRADAPAKQLPKREAQTEPDGHLFVDPSEWKKKKRKSASSPTGAAPGSEPETGTARTAAPDAAQAHPESAATEPAAHARPEIEIFVTPAQLRARAKRRAAPAPGGGESSAAADAAAALVPERRAGGRRELDRLVQADASSIRVGVQKVDQLINLVGELVITHAMLAQTAARADPAVYEALSASLGQFQRNTRDLQDAAMSIRMMPIASVFSRFPRVVHDIAAKLGKDIELKMQGEATELDKGLIERIVDPLTHLVRNSLDHGIEPPAEREAAGKPRKGTVTLSAFHQAGAIVIEVADDGRGMRRERILAKALERGMAVSETMSDQDVWRLIMEPGFSTAEQVTDVSGRGVGMDVVRRNVHAMGGRIEIATTPGAGTRMSIKLPLTLAILDGMSVRADGEIYIIPLGYISEAIRVDHEAVSTLAGGATVISVRGEYVPVLSLLEVFGLSGATPDWSSGILVVLDAEGGRTALFVDELVGQHQVVIKSLETNFRKFAGVSGATIMGDGRVAMILDVDHVVRLAHSGANSAA